MKTITLNQFAKFCMNYPNDFIERAWEGRIAEHLRSKFNRLYDSHGAAGAMAHFICDLDDGNTEILERYIYEWANPKRVASFVTFRRWHKSSSNYRRFPKGIEVCHVYDSYTEALVAMLEQEGCTEHLDGRIANDCNGREVGYAGYDYFDHGDHSFSIIHVDNLSETAKDACKAQGVTIE